MNTSRRRPLAFTLIELLVVMAIIAIITTGIISIGSYVRTNARVNATKGTMQILKSSLAAWHDAAQMSFHENIDSPLLTALQSKVPNVMDPEGKHERYTWRDAGDLTPTQQQQVLIARANCEYICYVLMEESASRRILDQLSPDVRLNEDGDLYQVGTRPPQPLYEIVDAWGKPIDYRPRGTGNFPRLVSAGPNGIFDDADDISSDEF